MDNGNGHNAQATTVVTVTITFDSITGQVGLTAPINNEMVLLYMLEKAKDAVKAFIAEQAKGQRIVPATSMPMISH
jgi:hypothetical protein